VNSAELRVELIPAVTGRPELLFGCRVQRTGTVPVALVGKAVGLLQVAKCIAEARSVVS
jgi:hypothetical protein